MQTSMQLKIIEHIRTKSLHRMMVPTNLVLFAILSILDLLLRFLQLLLQFPFSFGGVVEDELPVLDGVLLEAEVLLDEGVHWDHGELETLGSAEEIEYELVDEELAVLLVAEETVEVLEFLLELAVNHQIYCLADCEGYEVHYLVFWGVDLG